MAAGVLLSGGLPYVCMCVCVGGGGFCICFDTSAGRIPATGRIRCVAAQGQASQKHTHRCRDAVRLSTRLTCPTMCVGGPRVQEELKRVTAALLMSYVPGSRLACSQPLPTLTVSAPPPRGPALACRPNSLFAGELPRAPSRLLPAAVASSVPKGPRPHRRGAARPVPVACCRSKAGCPWWRTWAASLCSTSCWVSSPCGRMGFLP